MKKINKYSGKKLKRPITPTPYTRVYSRLITTSALNDAQFRLVCLLFSYSNGTTITTKNLAVKLNKKERTILDLYNQLSENGVLRFTDTHIELFPLGNLTNCENPQDDVDDGEIPQPNTKNSAHSTVDNCNSGCKNPQLNIVDDIDYLEDTDTYNNIKDKKNLGKTINENNSVTITEEYSSLDSDDEDDVKPQSSKSDEKDIPIIGKDFNPVEELIFDKTPNDGKTFWKLKNDVTSKFIEKQYVGKLADVYNKWINLDIIQNSKVHFDVFELFVIVMITSRNQGINSNEQLNRYIRMYPIDGVINYISEWIDGIDANSIDEVLKDTAKYRLINKKS